MDLFPSIWNNLFSSNASNGNGLIDTNYMILNLLKTKTELESELRSCSLIFVPVDRSLQGHMSTEFLRDHIAFDTNFEGEYRTASGKIVKISGNEARTAIGFTESRRVHISSIFPLNASNSNDKPHGVEISRPLSGGIDSPDNDDELTDGFTRKVIAALRCYPENESIFRELDSFILRMNQSFSESPSFIHKMNPPIQVVARTMWSNCCNRLIQEDSLSPRGKAPLSPSSKSMTYQASIESFIMTGIHAPVWQLIQSTSFERIKHFRTCMDRLSPVCFTDLQLSTEFQCDLTDPIREIQFVSTEESPADKLLAIKKTFGAINQAANNRSKFHFWTRNNLELSTDDIVSIMAMVIIEGYPKTGLLIADLEYLEKFRFVDTSTSHLGFSLNCLQTAIAWITEQFGDLSTSICCISSLSKSIISHYLNLPIVRKPYQSTDNLSKNYVDHDVILVSGDLAVTIASPSSDSGSRDHNDNLIISLEMNNVSDDDGGKMIDDDIIVWIDLTCSSMCVCTGQGKIRTVGLSTNGLLGMGEEVCYDDSLPMLSPYSIISTGVEKFIRVACGRHFTLALSSSGALFSWGKNDHGQLGLGSHHLSSYVATRPCLINGFDQTNMAISISCGDFHCLVSTDSGSIYSWGMSFGGRLGFEPNVEQNCGIARRLFSSPLNESSSKDNDQDELYHWPDVSSPTLISSFELSSNLAPTESSSTPVIVHVSCGSSHNIALSVDGLVYTWGIGKFGSLGHGDERNEHVPRQIEGIPSSAKIRYACANGNKSVFLTTQSKLIGCGLNVSVRIDQVDIRSLVLDYCSKQCHSSLPLAKRKSNTDNQISFPIPIPICQSEFVSVAEYLNMKQIDELCYDNVVWPEEVVQIASNDFEILARSSSGGVFSLGGQSRTWKELFHSKVSKVCANRRSTALVLGKSSLV